jgi:hypothetical protein
MGTELAVSFADNATFQRAIGTAHARNLEATHTTMRQRSQRGEPSAHFAAGPK